MPAKIDSSIAVRPASVPGILMKRFSRSALACSAAACSIVASASSASSGETSSEHEAVDPVGALVDVGEEVGGVAQVGERQLEEDPLVGVGADALAGLGGGADLGDLLVVGVAAGDRLVEDRRVRGQAR